MAEHEPSIGMSDDWHTPPEIFAALGLRFDLDPCAPTNRTHYFVPANKVYTKHDDGLIQPWHGLTFLNPPFGGRRGHVPWLKKFFAHANGVAIARAYTSSDWFHDYVVPARRDTAVPARQDEVHPPRRLDRHCAGPWCRAHRHGRGR